MSYNIRPVGKEDLNDLKIVIDSSELFQSELLDGMIADYFENEQSEAIWLTVDDNTPQAKSIAIAYCAPEQMTAGTYNLYLIAVHKDYQGKGIGTQIMEYVEAFLKEQGHRILLVETSGLPDFSLTRKFYDNNNYTRVATIKEFYAAGEDKIIFWKKLS